MHNKTLKNLVSEINPNTTPSELIDMLDCAFHYETGSAWLDCYHKMVYWLDSGMPANNLPFSVFAESGNKKLPFLAFSVLPGITCPGAADCLKWCYSYKSWRFAASWFRQLMNTMIIWNNKKAIQAELNKVLNKPKFQKMDKVVFRLYVDGDIDSLETMLFWFDVMRNHSKLDAYGYTKSLQLVIEASNNAMGIPGNYTLNISSNSIYDGTSVEKIAHGSSMVRGGFISVPVKKRFKNSEYKTKEYRQAVKESYGKSCFVCPGSCSDCTKSNGHACGSSAFNGVPIVIGIH